MTAPSDGDSCRQRLANRAVPHMCQSQNWTPVTPPETSIFHAETLPEHRTRRRPRHARCRHGQRFSPDLNILRRPDVVADRKQFEHWECDLIQFRQKFGKANVTSLVERVSRSAVFLRNSDHQSRPIIELVIGVLHHARRWITFDRGRSSPTGPTSRPVSALRPGSAIPVALAKRHRREHERPGQEMASRDIDPPSITNYDLKEICDRLNTTPRKFLGYKTPAEMFRQNLLAQMRSGGISARNPQVTSRLELTPQS